MNDVKKTKNCQFNLSYHIVWIPKYRKQLLVDGLEIRLKQLLYFKCDLLGLNLVAVECMPDHIHLFIKAHPNISISYIVKMLKGYTSFILRKEFIYLKNNKHLWANGYFCESIGGISEKTIIKYINNQKHYF